ncbi:unnamed protein product [Euphydryas editha]|uniref:Uncharacterized protein n=1 Tax=Euphydryas editha TaxID=104508 RepID=A0AAU9UKJ5_EUPED|nr:unnamed protein product [Euphydryas editha]
MSIWRREMGKQDSSWRRVLIVLVSVFVLCDSVSDKQMSETLQRALSAVRGPSPGAKKLLNIPEDGVYIFYAINKIEETSSVDKFL